jgi:serine/threonine protein kinase
VATTRISAFDFEPGRIIAGKYEIVSSLGKGWEGETYLLRERSTRIERAGKFFFPQRNRGDRTARRYARKLHTLRSCPIIVGYHTREHLEVEGTAVTLIVSEYVRGEPLSSFLRRQPGGRLEPLAALHLLHALAEGMACVHRCREYHGDLHEENVMVDRFGLAFELKILDLYNRGPYTKEHALDDLCDLIRLFYQALGGQRHYARQPPEIKQICRGLKRTLIVDRFPSVSRLRDYLENLSL